MILDPAVLMQNIDLSHNKIIVILTFNVSDLSLKRIWSDLFILANVSLDRVIYFFLPFLLFHQERSFYHVS